MCKRHLKSKPIFGIQHPYFVVWRTSFELRTRDRYLDLVNRDNLVRNFSQYAYLFSLHVSGNYVPIIRRNNRIYAILGTCYSVWMTVWYVGWKHVEKRNKYTKKNCEPIWLYLQDYTGMHGQQNVKIGYSDYIFAWVSSQILRKRRIMTCITIKHLLATTLKLVTH